MPLTARKAAHDILNHFESALKKHRSININDNAAKYLALLTQGERSHFTMLYKGVLRLRNKLDAVIGHFCKRPLKKVQIQVLNSMRIGLYELIRMRGIPVYACINECVNLAASSGGGAKAFVNGIMREIERNREKIPLIPKIENTFQAITYSLSYPEWFSQKLIDEWGKKDAIRFATALNSEETLAIRVNILKTDPDDLINELSREDIKAKRSEYAPEALLIPSSSGLTTCDAFKKGMFYIQNPSSQIAAHFLKPENDSTILDTCAGPGGKSTHLAELTGDSARIHAVDISAAKLKTIEENTSRLGIRSVLLHSTDFSKQLPANIPSLFDRVMVDAPCSALGTIRKNPDIKWTRREEDLKRLSKLQVKILCNSIPMLKKDGLMLYTVCTFSKEETYGTVNRFLDRNDGSIVADPISDSELCTVGNGLSQFLTKEGYFFIPPNEGELEAFFMARFRKPS